MNNITTVNDLKKNGIRVLPIKEEMKKNLIKILKSKKPLFEEIIGYENTVIPDIENAIFSYHDILFLGERGQAKSRLVNTLISLLDEKIPYLKGCEIKDNPYDPVCDKCKKILMEKGGEAEIAWLGREERIVEKLATPDTTLSELMGDIDPIKIAEGRYLSDASAIHYGLIPRSNRCIFAINELPDLPERIQVGLFNILEERQVQIKGFNLKFDLDVFITATANPEDYTNRGKVITPLRDRFNAQIRTHYPKTIEDEIKIIDLKIKSNCPSELSVYIPLFIKEIIATITHLLRKNECIDQDSGVSVRTTIDNYENVLAISEKRSIILNKTIFVPTIYDIYSSVFSTTNGKIEYNFINDDLNKEELIESIISKSIKVIFLKHFKEYEFEEMIDYIKSGKEIVINHTSCNDGLNINMAKFPHTKRVLSKIVSTKHSANVKSAFEFVLEGLFLVGKIGRIRSFEDKKIYSSSKI